MADLTYNKLIYSALELYRKGRFEESYDLLTENMDRVGGNKAQIFNFRYCSACRMGRPDLALDLLMESVEDRGYWYSYDYLLSDDDLAPLRNNPDFQALASVCRERESKAKSAAKTELRILRQTGGGERGLLIALHGNGENFEIAEGAWTSALGCGFDVALVQSSQITFTEGYEWSDLDRGIKDLRQQIRLLKRTYDLDRSSVVCGFSAGARIALASMLRKEIVPRKLVLVGPWLPDLDFWTDNIVDLGQLERFSCDVVCGTDDTDCFSHAKRLSELLDEGGVRHTLRLVDGLAHDFPDDFDEYLVKLLRT
ncbi:MAG TPA: hypothetical protein VMS79_04905 [Methanomassiliicoccales archaeon]|nr:hypothetical protein [Methanomassiliicoccales archaeon]